MEPNKETTNEPEIIKPEPKSKKTEDDTNDCGFDSKEEELEYVSSRYWGNNSRF